MPRTGPRRMSSRRFVNAPPQMADRGHARRAWILVLREEGGGNVASSRQDGLPGATALAGEERANERTGNDPRGPMVKAPGRSGTVAQAASPRWNQDATSSPLSMNAPARGTIELP